MPCRFGGVGFVFEVLRIDPAEVKLRYLVVSKEVQLDEQVDEVARWKST